MRMYGKRFLKRSMQRTLSLGRETMDAQVFTIVNSAKYCTVKIQGSDEEIRAWYPENWTRKPIWLKIGNSVKIMHTGGYRGRIEVIGSGLVVPNPEVGGSEPEIPDIEDIVLDGLEIGVAKNRLRNAVYITTGSVSINGETYEYTEVETDNEYLIIGDGGTIGIYTEVLHGGEIAVNPTIHVPAIHWPYYFGYWCVKFVYVDDTHIWIKETTDPFRWLNEETTIDGWLSLDVGRAPIDLSPPSDSILLGHIMVPQLPGTTDAQNNDNHNQKIMPWMINLIPQANPEFAFPGRPPGYFDIWNNNLIIDWGDTGTKDFTIFLKDIFGIEFVTYIATGGSTYGTQLAYIKAEIISGNGQIRGRPGQWHDDECIVTSNPTSETGSGYTETHTNMFLGLQYKRNGTIDDISPIIKLTLESDTIVTSYIYITLLDASGNPMLPAGS